MKKKVLITDKVHSLLIDGLTADGFDCDYRTNIPLAEVHKIAADYYGMVINSKILMQKELLDAAKQLRFVGRLGSGMEIIDQEYARERGVAVLSAPEGNCNAVAEHSLGMLLTLANKLLIADKEVRANLWQREANRGFEISGKTVGIIGFGHTGNAFAQKLQGMSLRILAYDKYKVDYTAPYDFVEESNMEEILAEADIISFHLPLTPENHFLVDRNFIQCCKKGVVLINTSRGVVIRTRDLIEAIENEVVGGACLDVFENEKPQTYTEEETKMYEQLFQSSKVVLSPHVAGWTHQSLERLAAVLLDKIRKVERNSSS